MGCGASKAVPPPVRAASAPSSPPPRSTLVR
jgi:hypothetical protein